MAGRAFGRPCRPSRPVSRRGTFPGGRSLVRLLGARLGAVLTACLLLLAAAAAHSQSAESLRLRVTNSVGGPIEASADHGVSWTRLGQVVLPADRVNPASYTAAGWAQDSHIAATAANAIHIKVASNPQTGRPMTLSLVPAGDLVGAANRQRSSAIFTDIPGGCSIFGGGLGPYVNSPVLLAGGTTAPLRPDYQPAEGDVLLIIRTEPARLPLYAVFENRAGGAITLDYGAGPAPIGIVDQPVSGVGRFEGGLYCWPGRVRANHPGVIDVSTAPHGMVGGFQIIPRQHASSPEMAYVKTGHQWMVIGPADPAQADWAGQPPFFSEVLLPSYRPDDVMGDYPDWFQRVLSRTMVQVRFGEGPWELMPRIAFSNEAEASNADAAQRGRRRLWLIPGHPRSPRAMQQETRQLADHALEGITALRIVFPQAICPLSGREN